MNFAFKFNSRRCNEELDAIDDRHRDELLAAERSRASLARQMVELERKAKEEHVRALDSNKKLLEAGASTR